MHPRSVIMIAALALSLAFVPAVSADLHVVQQVGISFTPQNIIVLAGDTVRWEWTSGSHTVTNGTGFLDPQAGTLFDTTINAGNPVFEYTFNDPGIFDYFCRPHEQFGMTGRVLVDAPTATDDTTWGRIKQLYGDDQD